MKSALAVLASLAPAMSQAANYSAVTVPVDGINVVRLTDAATHTEVAIVPSIGNMAYEMKVNGKNVFWTPFKGPAELRAKPALAGNPFLAPWANRIDQDAFYANGKKYSFNPDLGNLRRDGNQKPIHGLILFSEWTAVEVKADENSARLTSRFDFWRQPDLMAQFPFAHSLLMTYRLSKGVLEVETIIENLSTASIPVAVGYHPYFQVHDAPRDKWKVHLSARDHLTLSNLLIPTGERKPVAFPDPVLLEGTQLDDVFSGLIRGSDGRAVFSVQGDKQKVSVIYGPKYTVAVVYAPKGRDFICFEPMSAVTNAFNLAHAGVYKELQTVPAGGVWKESYWIAPSGF
ncbi:MAG: aldose 1-epimerase [Bryobacterales bacterium]|nr:aldose 1-epimerase [Bryobacterales bacterium]